ncbi:uncharacterized protein E0L32_005843 [Thyridium curvatum]|uniref:Alpha-N-acetylglucosaminidase n=1 Tax=Thyridium curvatum TaxID=1093900 RepID=A0A507BAM5_9PEZI|nr:uncharacterized protein E0L32_005843 [Thyridium curvatum]TPX13640.1 hypothetical protein E0L32_005843 [Thyridium curvatum]
MRVHTLLAWVIPAFITVVSASLSSTAGVQSLVKRRLPRHVDAFEFVISDTAVAGNGVRDSYEVSSTDNGKIQVKGTSTSAVISGLHRYLAEVVHLDVWWYIGSRLDQAPLSLPKLDQPLNGSAVVPLRYHFNTVTTSYTMAFWSWEDWELELDWMALRGINLPLAWVGVEKIFIDVFREVGFNDAEISSFLSGPAFQAWNRFGNIQGSWGGDVPFDWIEDQFKMQLKIVARMVELGMTPILPAFPGFVPSNVTRIWPDAATKKSPLWSGFSAPYSADTYLDPFDPHFLQLQKSFMSRQLEAFGNVTHYWTLDQFNENKPGSREPDYLRNVSHNTWQSLKAVDPDAIWVMQGWLFASDSSYWTNERVEAFLGGVTENSDMLILDLFAESSPQWQRTNSFFGKPWIWCQLHDYGGNMGLYGQIENVTINSMQAVRESKNLVGFGLSPEGQEGNEIIYDLLLDQSWSEKPIDTQTYFHDWVSSRYGGKCTRIPKELYAAWEMLRPTVYNNTQLSITNAVSKSILELLPSTSGLTGRKGHHSTVITYDPNTLVQAWQQLYAAGLRKPFLFAHPAYQYDLVDWTRQVLVNAFDPLYQTLVDAYKAAKPESEIRAAGENLTSLLETLDKVLSTNKHFRLSTWIDSARANARTNLSIASFFEYNARNQITLWGPTGQIEDYASKQWSGLVGKYYKQRWQMFVDYLAKTPTGNYNQKDFKAQLQKWEIDWNTQTSDLDYQAGELRPVVADAVKQWPQIFMQN